MNKDKQWEIALDTLVKVAHDAGVSESETNLWRVQHIDSSLSRLVRITGGSMSVIADGLYSPTALVALGRLYPSSDTIVYEKRDFSITRDKMAFRVAVGDSSCALADSDVLVMIQKIMSEFKIKEPRVM